MPRATQGTSEQELNQINFWMRQQPWYQQWFTARGLDANRVRLNDRQRQELASVAAQNGVQLGGRMKIDEAGNVNQQGGWAGMHPGWKAAIGGGVTAASMGLIPGVPGIPGLGFGGGGGGGVGAGGLGPGLNAASQGAAYNTGPLLMGSGALTPTAEALVTMASRQIGSGLGTSPSLAGLNTINGVVPGGLIPDFRSEVVGNAPRSPSLPTIPVPPPYPGGPSDQRNEDNKDDDGDWKKKALEAAIRAAMMFMAARAGSRSDEERALTEQERAFRAQAERLLKQQEQRTQFQNPLYAYITRQAYDLQPGPDKGAYPYNSLDDVQVP